MKEKFKEISEAYNVLSHVEKRSQYDQINGLGSGWKYEQEGSSFTNDEQYEQVLKEEAEKKKKTDEQAFEYFDKKYFQNRDFFKKNTIDDNEFELTMKLYKEHKAEVTEKKKDYVEFFPFTSSHYYVHKDVEAKALEKNQVESVILDFKVPILIIAFAMIGTGIYSGVGVKEKTKSSIQQSKIVTQGAGYRGNMVPVNIV